MDCIVIRIESLNVDSIARKQTNFSIDDRILSAALLISIVNHQDFHSFL
jgi:hypothetical protein